MANRLTRRPGTEGHKTYWLHVDADSAGFVKVHTADPDSPRQVSPRLAHVAAMVERAPELATTLRELMEYVGGWDAGKDHPCGRAAALLAEIEALDPEASEDD